MTYRDRALANGQKVLANILAAARNNPADPAAALVLGCQRNALYALGRVARDLPWEYTAAVLQLYSLVPPGMLEYLDRAVRADASLAWGEAMYDEIKGEEAA